MRNRRVMDGACERGLVRLGAGTRSVLLAAGILLLGPIVEVSAQSATGADEPPPEIMTSLGLATQVPESKGFVQRSRPVRETLEFGTPYATDKIRPRPRNAAEVEALKRDLDAAAARNRTRAGTPTPTGPALESSPGASR
jgi:hypothetical protein